jgi:membrane fusion protein, multidrug efflux system
VRRSYVIALVIALALGGWMASGQPAVRALFGGSDDREVPPMATPALQDHRKSVRVAVSEAVPVAPQLVLHGRTEPFREVVLRAETYGRVQEVLVPKGALVEAGQRLIRLDPREREAMVDQARALLQQRELEYEAARSLGTRGFQAENQVAAARAAREAARAELQAREVVMAHTIVTAPFDGVLDERQVEVGDFVDTGDVLAEIVELDPLLISAEVAETQKAAVVPGMQVEVELADGQRLTGTVRFVAKRSDPATRTYRIEAEVANPNHAAPAGMSATVHLHFPVVAAHELSAALLALDEHHALGVKTVDENDVVRFVPVELVRARADAIWVAGLPQRAWVIVVGQGFVQDGESVRPVEVDGSAAGLAGLGR